MPHWNRIWLVEIELWTIGNFVLNFSMLIDAYSGNFVITVMIITYRVLMFSYSYMNASNRFFKFHLLIVTFVFSIVLLIISPNLVTLILGWDGLGVSSFFLVIFYKRNKAFNAGLITALTNRLGDAFIIISFSVLWAAPSINLAVAPISGFSASVRMMLMIVAAARTKSAQVPFRAWLPAAIAAPTPVSALVHSSTLVTAGVYVLIRVSPILRYTTIILVGSLGSITSLMASLAALLETDLKKIVALSTLRQLGIIMLRIRLATPTLAFFHLIAHAFFKALLFIATGQIIHRSGDYQDLRRMGGNSTALPYTQGILILTKIRLCGLPFFSGFYSKECVLESLSRSSQSRVVTYLVIWVGVGLTMVYSLRFVYYVVISTRTLSLIRKEDVDRFVLIAYFYLIGGSLRAAKKLSERLADSLPLPLVSVRAKLRVLIMLTVLAPVVFYLCSFSPPKRDIKSLMSLFFLSSWRGAAPMFVLSHFSYSSNWIREFGWTDLLLVNWTLLLAEKRPSWSLNTRSLFKVLGGVTMILVLWRI